jgi:hypothetical protein
MARIVRLDLNLSQLHTPANPDWIPITCLPACVSLVEFFRFFGRILLRERKLKTLGVVVMRMSNEQIRDRGVAVERIQE